MENDKASHASPSIGVNEFVVQGEISIDDSERSVKSVSVSISDDEDSKTDVQDNMATPSTRSKFQADLAIDNRLLEKDPKYKKLFTEKRRRRRPESCINLMTKGKGTGQKDNINDQIFSLRILPGSDLNSLKDSLWIIKISTQPDVEKTIARAFSDFYWLYHQLQNNHWGKTIPPPTRSNILVEKDEFAINHLFMIRNNEKYDPIFNFKPEYIISLQLMAMIKHIFNDKVLRLDSNFIDFISWDDDLPESLQIVVDDSTFTGDKILMTSSQFRELKEFHKQSKKVESITNSHASLIPITELTEIYISPTKLFSRKDYQRLFQPQSTDNTFNNNDPLIQEWIPKSKTLFTSLSFGSSAPTYQEASTEIQACHDWVSISKEQWKQLLYHVLQYIVDEAVKVNSVINEFTECLKQISLDEVIRANSELFLKFSKLNESFLKKFKGASRQDILKLIILFDENVRFCESFESILNQRSKLGKILSIIEVDLDKRKNFLDKLSPGNNNSNNEDLKIRTAEDEYRIVLKRYNRVKQSWEKIMEDILNERKEFEEREAAEVNSCLKSIRDLNMDEKKHYLQLWQDFVPDEHISQ
ncbi:ANM_HP_G0156320.mRNA.1.CDS.1 [Saccharomyces cerevisiae]|nr:ANM_HP_G0143130.mRNA.1.CDS.1 [Saccharomyces cerevisiae]CAI4993089.1 ANM_HP_G0156320.mRNA.1.CDS.1 [Saccharomyces cerevisiae]CAI6772250.1 ANM_HP_G0143130.mRNA.1.CDS.1 [Saccharomyces cerevisiae]CAI6873771.1 ANM_HP_G0156320.mRNA.1.CDS.1 [Saccharomyces cerevisiae]